MKHFLLKNIIFIQERRSDHEEVLPRQPGGEARLSEGRHHGHQEAQVVPGLRLGRALGPEPGSSPAALSPECQ